ncbi:hypothetical protein RSOLAG1IB_10735 [Rhizoctonia solani AG-1 IB]|uniref:Transmembrane protein n=1 Tax=Thanatephorus cucumeris (strain AG1-IB / isolate 7/3/14) TaxID=1108050 RepID=A0A0B7FZM2_THACB|nr:hypothetical protein RSOLAG1IB_10735 [Rhizoctonia solani AG-1 IB]
MTTNMVFAMELNKDFIGQYYGSTLAMDSLNNTRPSNYRKQIMAALQVITTDSLIIMGRDDVHLSNPALSTRIYFSVDPDTAEPIPSRSAFTYVNGTRLLTFPQEAMLYVNTIYNLMHIVISAVNLDLSNSRTPNIFTNATFFREKIRPNLPPNGLNSTVWAAAEGARTFYYGSLAAGYQTWAQMLLDGKPVELGNPTGLPEQSAMVTTYLCPVYQVKPTKSLLASVFVGSATMTISIWGIWMIITTFVAKRISPPRVQCHCSICKEVESATEAQQGNDDKENAHTGRAGAGGLADPGVGMVAKLKAWIGIGGRVTPTPISSENGLT